jgi:hypothetical protein
MSGRDSLHKSKIKRIGHEGIFRRLSLTGLQLLSFWQQIGSISKDA